MSERITDIIQVIMHVISLQVEERRDIKETAKNDLSVISKRPSSSSSSSVIGIDPKERNS